MPWINSFMPRAGHSASPFLASGSELRLDRDVTKTDLLFFEQAIADGDLETAVSIYEGPLLDGFYLSNSRELETWLDGERGRLAGVHEKALGREGVRHEDRAQPPSPTRSILY